MKPSIFTSFDYNIPFTKAVGMIRDAGFEVIALGPNKHSEYDSPEGRKKIKNLVTANNMQIDSVHAPFPEGDQLFSLDEAKRLESVRQCKLAVDASAYLDGGAVAIHLIPYGITDPELERRMVAQGMKSIGELVEYAVDRRVVLGLENGQREGYDRILEMFLKEFESPAVGLCYDSGHENVKGSCFEMLEKYGHRLNSVHIHDNTGSDTHLLPYQGNINWNGFRSIFHDLDYAGSLCLEVHPQNSGFKSPEVFLVEAKKRALELLYQP